MMILPAAAFAALGLLLGTLAGLSTTPVVITLIGALFAFVGGSAAAFFGKLDAARLRLASLGVLAMSVCMLIGLVGGITVRANRLLTLEPAERTEALKSARGEIYLRSLSRSALADLRAQLIAEKITLEEACRQAMEPKAQ